MPDFKFKFKPLKPTPQRLAAAMALKDIAPKIYAKGVKNGDLSPFVFHVQKMWRLFLGRLKRSKIEYPILDTKKFGYARNCPPVLVESEIEGNARLVPCNLPMCPFCWARKVMALEEKLSNFLEMYDKTYGPMSEDKMLIAGALDLKNYPLMHTLSRLSTFVHSLPSSDGTISNSQIWVGETGQIEGKVSFVSFGSFAARYPKAFERCARPAPQQEPCGDPELQPPAEETVTVGNLLVGDKPKHPNGKVLGHYFSYPSRLLYLKSAPDVDLYKSVQFQLVDAKKRKYRSSGFFYGSKTSAKSSGSDSNSTRSWRSQVDSRLSEIEIQLDTIITLLKETKDGREYMGG